MSIKAISILCTTARDNLHTIRLFLNVFNGTLKNIIFWYYFRISPYYSADRFSTLILDV